MSFWENENAAKQIRSDAEFDTVFKNGVLDGFENV